MYCVKECVGVCAMYLFNEEALLHVAWLYGSKSLHRFVLTLTRL